MSLKDDMDALREHIANGTGREFLEGTAPILPVDLSLPPAPQRPRAEQDMDR